MTRLSWARPNPSYEVGVDRGVYFDSASQGVVWNGLISLKETPDEGSEQISYQDGVKVRNKRRLDCFAGTIEAFTFPLAMDGRPFGLSYRVMSDDSYKIHIVYNVLTSPPPKSYQYQDPSVFGWDFTTIPQNSPGGIFVSHLVIDTFQASPSAIADLEEMLYGNEVETAHLPTMEEVLELFEMNALFKVIDHGDGSWTAIGPDPTIVMTDPTTFAITWPTAVYISDTTYTITSF